VSNVQQVLRMATSVLQTDTMPQTDNKDESQNTNKIMSYVIKNSRTFSFVYCLSEEQFADNTMWADMVMQDKRKLGDLCR